YVFKGRRPWPSSLQQSNADYVVQAVGSLFSGAANGFSLSGVGDFNGDGVDDFAMGAPGYNGGVGRVSVVLGVAAGQPFGTNGVVSLPADYGTKAVQIDASGGTFGVRLSGIRNFYAGGGSTLMANAPVSAGYVAAFHGSASLAALTTPNQTLAGPVTEGRAGNGLAFLGGGGLLPVVGVGSPAYPTNPSTGRVDIFAGAVSSGPFSGTHAIYTNSRAATLGDGFGIMVVGGAFSSGVTTSFLGDSAPDVVLGAFKEGGAATH